MQLEDPQIHAVRSPDVAAWKEQWPGSSGQLATESQHSVAKLEKELPTGDLNPHDQSHWYLNQRVYQFRQMG